MALQLGKDGKQNTSFRFPKLFPQHFRKLSLYKFDCVKMYDKYRKSEKISFFYMYRFLVKKVLVRHLFPLNGRISILCSFESRRSSLDFYMSNSVVQFIVINVVFFNRHKQLNSLHNYLRLHLRHNLRLFTGLYFKVA